MNCATGTPPITSVPPTVPGTFPDGVCNFENGFCAWKNINEPQTPNSDWTLGQGYTGGSGFLGRTGPSFDYSTQIPSPGVCPTSNFDSDFGYFVQDTTDNFNWQRQRGSTPSTFTGPNFDCNTGTATG
jgi:hypothetical protein